MLAVESTCVSRWTAHVLPHKAQGGDAGDAGVQVRPGQEGFASQNNDRRAFTHVVVVVVVAVVVVVVVVLVVVVVVVLQRIRTWVNKTRNRPLS